MKTYYSRLETGIKKILKAYCFADATESLPEIKEKVLKFLGEIVKDYPKGFYTASVEDLSYNTAENSLLMTISVIDKSIKTDPTEHTFEFEITAKSLTYAQLYEKD